MFPSTNDENPDSRLLHELVDFAEKDVLEIGCGDGRMTWRYGHLASSVLAIDPKEDRISRAIEKTPVELRNSVIFRVGDITGLQLPEATFDIALLSWSL